MRCMMFICIIIMGLTACTMKTCDNTIVISEDATEQNSYINEDATEQSLYTNEWRTTVSSQLLSEFYEYYNNMYLDDIVWKNASGTNTIPYNIEHDKTSYNRIMAADRATALLGVYRDYISQSDVEFIESVSEEINKYMNQSLIRFGYSKSGYHIIALLGDGPKNSVFFEPLCDKIRGTKEMKFFDELLDLSGYYMCDVFIENLSPAKMPFHMDVKLMLSNGIENPIEVALVNEFSEEDLLIFDKYQRSVPTSNNLVISNEWNLLASKKFFDMVEVRINDEVISLVDLIVKQ